MNKQTKKAAILCLGLAVSARFKIEVSGLNNSIENLEASIRVLNQEKAFVEMQNQQFELERQQAYDNWIAQIQIQQEYERQWKRDLPLDEAYQQYIYDKSVEYGLEYDLLLAIAFHESNFNVSTVNTTNSNGTHDYGLFQVNSGNLKWVNDLSGQNLDIENNTYDNIIGGIVIFNYYYSYWKNEGLEGDKLDQYALNSYNAGIAGYKKMGYVSRTYDRSIRATRDNFKSQLN